MLLNQALRRAVRYFPNNIATICDSQRQTYAELQRRVHNLAGSLQERGIQPGDRVGLLMLNSPEFVEAVFACFEIGAVIVPLNTRLAADELVFIINDAECVALLTDDALQPLVASFQSRLTTVRHFITTNHAADWLDYESLIASNNSTPRAFDGSEYEMIGLFYTSGTTGLPKGVMLSHRNLWMNAMHTLIGRPVEANAVFLHCAPMFHLADFPALINLTLNGGAHAILRRFDPQAVLEIIAREHVTTTMMVPTMVNFVIHHPAFENYDLSGLQRIAYGASPMPVELLKQAMRKLPTCEFSQGYGQSESSPLLTVLPHEDHLTEGEEKITRRLASCGRPVIGVEVEVFNDNDHPVAPGEVGEIVARGPNVMLGYWKRPEETERALRGGWLRTGDMAVTDEDGYIFIVDRKKDMIISGGENVYSSEVENVLYTHPAIREAAIIGTPHQKWGEAVTAVITLKPGATLTEDELIAYCKAHLADYKCPRRVEIRDEELPKSGTGKILKKELRAPYWEGYGRQVN